MITVLLSTRDRAQVLARCLGALGSIEAPPGGVELVVVDNGSIDDTATVLDGYQGKTSMSRLFEPRPGKNFALNTALDDLGPRLAESELVVFTDDDVLPDPDWLLQLQSAASRFPDADLFGGAIHLVWTSPPPAWLAAFDPHFDVLFARTERGDGPCPPQGLWGPNLAIRGHVFADGLRFDPRFGPNGRTDFAMGSETELAARLAAAGRKAYFSAGARVGHMLDGAGLTRKAVLRRAGRHGRGVMRRLLEARPGRPAIGAPFWVLQRLLTFTRKSFFEPEPARSSAAFQRAWHFGAALEALRPRGGRGPTESPKSPG